MQDLSLLELCRRRFRCGGSFLIGWGYIDFGSLPGKTGVITPKGRFWLRRARRWLLPVECASLQGIVYTKELTGGKLCELAGNAQVSTHTMAAIIATNTYSGPPGRQ